MKMIRSPWLFIMADKKLLQLKVSQETLKRSKKSKLHQTGQPWLQGLKKSTHLLDHDFFLLQSLSLLERGLMAKPGYYKTLFNLVTFCWSDHSHWPLPITVTCTSAKTDDSYHLIILSCYHPHTEVFPLTDWDKGRYNHQPDVSLRWLWVVTVLGHM